MAMRTFLEEGEQATRRGRLCRALDLFGAACAILFVLPLIVLLSVLVACEGPGPVLVRHRHRRADGSHYDLLNFRTQPDTQMATNGRAGIDPGLSGFGVILRTTGLDGVPTLFNVFAGELPICGRYSLKQAVAWLSTTHPTD
jgi:lipopolysaccharide/colanic/teichoic acid biosynthesis glycosyltransferase